jgi:hypothetical protein
MVLGPARLVILLEFVRLGRPQLLDVRLQTTRGEGGGLVNDTAAPL